jgi:uncharacterized lipoprotein YajG
MRFTTNHQRILPAIVAVLLALSLLSGCAADTPVTEDSPSEQSAPPQPRQSTFRIQPDYYPAL